MSYEVDVAGVSLFISGKFIFVYKSFIEISFVSVYQSLFVLGLYLRIDTDSSLYSIIMHCIVHSCIHSQQYLPIFNFFEHSKDTILHNRIRLKRCVKVNNM